MITPHIANLLLYWDDYSDKERWVWILNNPGLFSVQVDNDCITVLLKEDIQKPDPPYYQMDEYGYRALVELLQSQEIDADLV